jgi:cob(I)alamin adenosyltransferase
LNMAAQPGFIHVYTGNGKGKTTAALGLALRAAGWGMKTYIAQFLKKGESGEALAVARYLSEFISLEQFGSGDFHVPGKGIRPEEREGAIRGLAAVREAMIGGAYRLVILDEINILLHFKILDPDPVLALLARKPDGVELILTGRLAPKAILEKADLITEMRDVRHYHSSGQPARKGIER